MNIYNTKIEEYNSKQFFSMTLQKCFPSKVCNVKKFFFLLGCAGVVWREETGEMLVVQDKYKVCRITDQLVITAVILQGFPLNSL